MVVIGTSNGYDLEPIDLTPDETRSLIEKLERELAEIERQKTPMHLLNVYSPWEYVRDEISTRGWSFARFCRESGLDEIESLGPVMTSSGRVTEEIAEGLCRAFGPSREFWLKLQRRYDERHRCERTECNKGVGDEVRTVARDRDSRCDCRNHSIVCWR